MNIVDTVKSFIGSDVVDKMGSSLGVGQSQARSAVNAAVPALLAGITGVASTPDGARRLDSIVDQQDEGLLNNLPGAIGGRGESLMNQGSSMLSSLFGGGMTSGLMNGLSKFTGLGGTAITSLLGMLAPVIFGALRKQKDSLGLDAGGLANMLVGQKQNITAAMPAGLANALGNVPGLSGVFDSARAAVGSAYDNGRRAVASSASSARTMVSSGAGSGTSALRWILPLLVIGLLAWTLISWLSRGPSATPITPAQPHATPVTPTPVANTASTLTGDLHSVFDSAKDALDGVTDADSAQQALPKFQQINSRLDALRSTYDSLGATERSTIGNLVSSFKDTIQPEIDRVKALPGVDAVLGPAVHSMMDKLNAFSS